MSAFDEHFFKAFVQASDAVLYIKDSEGKILDVNDNLANLHNTSREEIIGHTDYDFCSKEKADEVIRNDKKVLDSGTMLTFREELDISGKKKAFLSCKFPLKNYQGHDLVLAGISIQITE